MHHVIPSILTFVVVILVARFFGMLFRKAGQPSVMGEVLGGIILGPSVVGAFFPQVTAALFHEESLTFLKHVAEIGIILYLFIMGLELNLPRLRQSARSAFFVSQTSIILPFILGLLLATYLYEHYAPADVGYWRFALFIGISLSITAFPVLARILVDSKMQGTRLGDLALTCAAIDDITAWCLVAIITGFMKSPSSSWMPVALTIFYIFFMLRLARPVVEKILRKTETSSEHVSQALLACAVLGALISATMTDLIGIHAFFGAFLFGAIIPHESLLAREVRGRLEDFVAILFLPAFFALTGVKTQMNLLSDGQDMLICALIVVLAIAGKFGGAFIGSVASGQNIKDATILGILINTRGLVELIVLNIGLSAGFLTPTLFTMLVIMALVTTFMTGPLLRWADPPKNS